MNWSSESTRCLYCLLRYLVPDGNGSSSLARRAPASDARLVPVQPVAPAAAAPLLMAARGGAEDLPSKKPAVPQPSAATRTTTSQITCTRAVRFGPAGGTGTPQ